MRDFVRVALERDARSLAFLDEVRSPSPTRPPRPRPARPRLGLITARQPGRIALVFDTRHATPTPTRLDAARRPT